MSRFAEFDGQSHCFANSSLRGHKYSTGVKIWKLLQDAKFTFFSLKTLKVGLGERVTAKKPLFWEREHIKSIRYAKALKLYAKVVAYLSCVI